MYSFVSSDNYACEAIITIIKIVNISFTPRVFSAPHIYFCKNKCVIITQLLGKHITLNLNKACDVNLYVCYSDSPLRTIYFILDNSKKLCYLIFHHTQNGGEEGESCGRN